MSDLSKRIENLSMEQIELLLRQVRSDENAAQPPIRSRPRDIEALPLSFSQQRLWFYHNLIEGSTAYNLPCAFRLVGQLDREILEKSLTEILRRHEALRTIFPAHDGSPVQVIQEAWSIHIPVVDLRSLPPGEQQADVQQRIIQQWHEPFNLSQGPLLRFQLLQLLDEEWALLWTFHHIIFDGWSEGIFLREFSQIYNAFRAGLPSPLPTLPLQYADFALWQREQMSGEALASQLAYWKQQLAHVPTVLTLPMDRPRAVVQEGQQTEEAHEETIEVDGEVYEALKKLSQRHGATMFMTLLAAFSVLLYRYSGQADFLIGSPIAGRRHVASENLIGFFCQHARTARKSLTESFISGPFGAGTTHSSGSI